LWLIVTSCDALIAQHYKKAHSWLPVAVPLARGLLILAEACAVGFAEELTYRAYLIPRVEAATGAAWIGVVLSVALFGFVHMYKGFEGDMHTLAAAVVWGVGFWLTRRIWPLALSHAMIDFIVHTHLGAAAVG
jgi:membrane protease YdiL (CAAX protease family)